MDCLNRQTSLARQQQQQRQQLQQGPRAGSVKVNAREGDNSVQVLEVMNAEKIAAGGGPTCVSSPVWNDATFERDSATQIQISSTTPSTSVSVFISF